jgi:hypothetical protein
VRLTTCAAAASSSKVPAEADVVVVGAGLAGLNAAAVLRKRGLSPVILEAGDAVGGRTRTDNVDGFLLDRGFQIFLTGYPEARETLDYEALQLQPFYAGERLFSCCVPFHFSAFLQVAFQLQVYYCHQASASVRNCQPCCIQHIGNVAWCVTMK